MAEAGLEPSHLPPVLALFLEHSPRPSPSSSHGTQWGVWTEEERRCQDPRSPSCLAPLGAASSLISLLPSACAVHSAPATLLPCPLGPGPSDSSHHGQPWVPYIPGSSLNPKPRGISANIAFTYMSLQKSPQASVSCLTPTDVPHLLFTHQLSPSSNARDTGSSQLPAPRW